MLKLLTLILIFSTIANSNLFADENNQAVILVHGLARTPKSMAPLAEFLKKNGYHPHLLSYPSRKDDITTLTKEHLEPVVARLQQSGYRKIHFVTHSMGGILVRELLARKRLPELGAVVMLAPPNQGSQIVDKIGHWKIFSYINGPAGNQLGTNKQGITHQLPHPNFPLCIIAGDRSINPINSLMIPGKDDGKVSIENTKVEGMTQHIVLQRTHPMIMRAPETFQHTLAFLQLHSSEPK
jgi:triacylglycerol lipase